LPVSVAEGLTTAGISERQRQYGASRTEGRKEEADDDLEEGWKLEPGMIELVERSTWLRDELQDEGLRHLLLRVVTASKNVVAVGGGAGRNDRNNRRGRNAFQRNNYCVATAAVITEQEQLLERLKSEYPQFGNFLDKLLLLAGILERQDLPPNNNTDVFEQKQAQNHVGGDDHLETWLRQDQNCPRESFVLKPIQRRSSQLLVGNRSDDNEEENGCSSSTSASSTSASSYDSDSSGSDGNDDEDSK